MVKLSCSCLNIPVVRISADLLFIYLFIVSPLADALATANLPGVHKIWSDQYKRETNFSNVFFFFLISSSRLRRFSAFHKPKSLCIYIYIYI